MIEKAHMTLQPDYPWVSKYFCTCTPSATLAVSSVTMQSCWNLGHGDHDKTECRAASMQSCKIDSYAETRSVTSCLQLNIQRAIHDVAAQT